jgi:low temperature requirement protein LtrA
MDEEQQHERPAAWQEIVYDLVFVVSIAELAAGLEGEIGWGEVARFVLLLVPIWWVWMGVTLANNRFTGDELGRWLLTLVNLLAAAGLAVTVGEATGERALGFAAAFLVARGLVIAQWIGAGIIDSAARPLTTRLVAGSIVALVPWLISFAVSAPKRYGLWAVGLAIDLLVPLTTLNVQRQLPRLNTWHLAERYRLFTIIVLGEAVAGVIRGASETERLPLLSAALALALAFGLGCAAFESPLSGPGLSGPHGMASGYLLFPLIAELTALGAAVTDIITHSDVIPSQATRWLLCGSVALALLSIGALEMVQAPRLGSWSRPALRVASA